MTRPRAVGTISGVKGTRSMYWCYGCKIARLADRGQACKAVTHFWMIKMYAEWEKRSTPILTWIACGG